MTLKLITPKPDQDLIRALEDLLKLAKKGDIDGIAATVTKREQGRYYIVAGRLYDNHEIAAGYNVHFQYILATYMDKDNTG